MSPARMPSTSSKGPSISASSIAGPSATMAALTVSWLELAGRSLSIWTAISASATGFCQPVSDTLAPDGSTARCIRKPTNGASIFARCLAAGAPKPTFQPICRSPASRRVRRLRSCACIPRAMRGSFKLEALLGDDVPLALEHDEELVAVAVQMPLVAGARFEHGPADHVIRAGGFLVDQELHLHVDPAVVALEPFDLRHVLDVGPVHRRAELGRGDAGRRLHGLR